MQRGGTVLVLSIDIGAGGEEKLHALDAPKVACIVQIQLVKLEVGKAKTVCRCAGVQVCRCAGVHACR